ncbi:MAG: DUF2490 domain-containing protein [Bacteroidia bacterium]|nr:DUF2490 domain-containing protein [Bacteroidia bacterium]
MKKNLSQVFHLQLRQEYRFYKDLTQFRENLSEVGVQVNFTPNLSFTPGYRFSVVRSGFHHRIFGDLIYKFKPIPTGLRTEIRLRTLRTFETEGKASTAIRPRVLFEFPLKKSPFTPFAGTELFYSFQDGTQGFSRYRLLAGSKVKLNDTFSLCLNYQMQHSLHKSPWLMEHIFMAGLKIDLD